MHEKKKIIKANNDEKLLEILKSELKDLSIRTIKNYIKHGMVIVNEKKETNSGKLIKKNSEIIIYFTLRKSPQTNLEIIYEDNDLIAINKPSGLLSISNSKEKNITAFRLVREYLKTNNSKAKLFVVHRLDEQTSGVLLFAKNIKIKEMLQRNWNDLVKIREYYCIIKGNIPKEGIIKSYLTMNHFQIVHSTKDKTKGKLAITNYKLIKYKNTYSLVQVNIATGRRNQIRVHLSEMGHPIVGDKKYGSKINPIGRLALHASKLTLLDPRTNTYLELKSNIPDEITNLVQ